MNNRTTYHLIVGEITCPDVANLFGKSIGDPEYQFSDGPAGDRSRSDDFVSFDAGVRALRPCRVVYEDGTSADFN